MTRSRAFTLIELLVVIAIIAVLMGILMPSLRAARELARGIACQANQKSLTLAYTMYAGDYDMRIAMGFVSNQTLDRPMWVKPPLDETGQLVSGDNVTLQDRLRGIQQGVLYKYIRDPEMYHCPGDDRVKSASPGQALYRSYIIPDVLAADEGFAEFSNVSGRHQRVVFKLTEIRNPSARYAFCESEFRPTNFNYDHGGWTFAPWVNQGWWDALATFHKNSATFGFADGHAERHSWAHKETWKLFNEGVGQAAPSDPAIPFNKDIEWCWVRYPYLSAGEKP
jgi:prepilin-type N-terminal cleavage/methylation domain-containing protein/prepilin-type processing-associated H-X9-DG protein